MIKWMLSKLEQLERLHSEDSPPPKKKKKKKDKVTYLRIYQDLKFLNFDFFFTCDTPSKVVEQDV